jgi:hypothetical protein
VIESFFLILTFHILAKFHTRSFKEIFKNLAKINQIQKKKSLNMAKSVLCPIGLAQRKERKREKKVECASLQHSLVLSWWVG